MKKLHTEREVVVNNQHFAFRLRNLYLENEALFYQIADYLPNGVHINNRDNFEYAYANSKMLTKGPEFEKVLKDGINYLYKISCPILLKSGINRTRLFNALRDFDAICNNPQRIRLNNKMTYVISNKLILNNDKYLNINSFMDEMGAVGKLYSEVLKPIHRNEQIWQQFQSLTKQEKRILRLVANGETNKLISDKLFISEHTVHSHRKSINKKLDTNSIAKLVKFAMALDLLNE